MSNILKTTNFEKIQEIYNKLEELDSKIIYCNIELRRLKREFILKRDIQLITKLNAKLEYIANKLLLLQGRLKKGTLGFNLFRGKDYRQYPMSNQTYKSGTMKYIDLYKSNYSGKKFSAFMKKGSGAKAQIGEREKDGKEIILSILIPENKLKSIKL